MPHFIHSHRQSKSVERNVFLVDSRCHPQSIAVVETRAKFLGVEMVVTDYRDFDFSTGRVCGALVQYPNTDGQINDYRDMIEKAHKNEVLLSVVLANLCSSNIISSTCMRNCAHIYFSLKVWPDIMM